MKQATDKKTFELDLAGGKRGRGRPPKADALTPAERARRYREAKRASPGARAKVQGDGPTPEEYMRAKRMYWSLEGKVDAANAERDLALKANADLRERLRKLESYLGSELTLALLSDE